MGMSYFIFLPHPTANLSPNFINSTLKMHLQFHHFFPPVQRCCSGPCHHLSSSWWILQSPNWCSCTTEQPEWASSLFGSQFMTFFLPKPFNKSSSHLNWVTVTSMVSEIHSVTSIVSLFLAHLCTPALFIHILSFNVLISFFPHNSSNFNLLSTLLVYHLSLSPNT